MNVGDSHYKCPRCGLVKEKTVENFYFKSGTRHVNGYCRPCHKVWLKAYWAAAFPYQKDRHRVAAREYNRRLHGVRPENYRVGREVVA